MKKGKTENGKSALQERFEYEEILKVSRPLLGENYIFDVAKYPSLEGFKVVHQEVFLQRTPLALAREIYLGRVEGKQTTLKLRIVLCWNGFRDAIDLLFGFAEAFERPIPVEAVVNVAETYQIGDFGLAWSWLGKKDPNMLYFARNNVLITLQGKNLVAVAKEIDGRLKQLDTTKEYAEKKDGIFSEMKRKEGEVPKVEAGGSLVFPSIPTETKASFFLTTSGSVNRDPKRPSVWYYRAGMEKGKHEIILFRTNSGILPKKERIVIEVT